MSSASIAAFGHLLRQYRHAAGLTQQELAERAGLAGRAISDLERGARNRPYRDTVIRLADALGVPEPVRDELFAAARRVVASPRMDGGADTPEPIQLVRDLPHPLRSEICHNLPVPLSSFVGRERERAEVRRLLAGPASTSRLVTLTGPPGVGKTRLAIEVALDLIEDFPDGIVFVPLAAIADPNLVVPAIAQACRVEGCDNQRLVDCLAEVLRGRRALLVLDNFEQILAAAPLVARLLEHSPILKALVTSRSRLQVRGEREIAIPPLAVPNSNRDPLGRVDQVSSLAQSAAVQLFVERARDARPDFDLTKENAAAVAEICRRLDGLPLAIELSARRGKILTPDAILAHLQDRFQLLTSGPADGPVHQQTLHQAIAWSYDLLSPDEQQLFRQVAVFVGGFTLQSASLLVADDQEATSPLADSTGNPARTTGDEAPKEGTGARAVLTRGSCDDGRTWGLDLGQSDLSEDRTLVWTASTNGRAIVAPETVWRGVETLVDRSLVDPVEGGSRFRMLESIREFGLERLAASGELETLRLRHAACFRALAEKAADHYRGPDEGEWLDFLEREHENLRAALRFLIERNKIGHALRMAGLLQWLWMIRGYVDEASIWVGQIMPLAESSEYAADRARMLRATACLELSTTASKRLRLLESLEISRAIGDRVGIADSLARLGLVTRDQGDYRAAGLLFEESLGIFRDLGNQPEIAAQLDRIGIVAFYAGESETACALLEESLAIRRTQDDQIFLGWALHEFGRIRHGLGEPDLARRLFEEALAMWREQEYHDGIGYVCASLGDLDLDQGWVAAAYPRLVESLGLFRDLGELGELTWVLELFSGLAASQNHPERALRLVGAAAAIRLRIGWPIPPDYKARLERRLAGARHALGEGGVAAATAEGQAMTLEQAVALALEG